MNTTQFLRLLQDGLENSSQLTPDKAVAVVEGNVHSYSELQNNSSCLANALVERGLKPGQRVAIYMDNTWPCIVSIFAILKAGGVFLVINPQTKADKLQYMLTDCAATILLSDAHLEMVFGDIIDDCDDLHHLIYSGKELNNHSYRISIEKFDSVVASTSPLKTTVKPIPGDLCALIYTSGSTGNPKGVMHTHQSMVFAVGSLIEYLRLSAQDRILNVLPMAFDYGLYQLLMSTWLGATLILERSFTYPAMIYKRIKEQQVTVFPGVPTIYAMLAASHRKKPLQFPSVTRVTNTAAALSSSSVPALAEIFPNALIYKMYGLTECKRVCYLEPELINSHADSVGKAIPGTETFLLTSTGERIHGSGEGILHVRGPHIMAGYWNQPELSADMIKSGDFAGDRVLCTHDWFRMDEEGFLYFVGRRDDIIKSRGEKVSPVEVESALLLIPGVIESAVFGVADEVLGQAIVAYVSVEDKALTGLKIKKLVTAKLENFMVPKEVIVLESLPESTNGKIDKKALMGLSL
ncbi:AMP-binding protein [Draconibacterium sp.]|nr:AMP-binding protein [Draconibacterium sp.]